MKVNKTEIVIYICAAAIIAIIASNTPFSTDFINLVGGISGALALLGVVALALALLWRRFKIWDNRKLYKEKAEAVEPSQTETINRALRLIAFAWIVLIIIGTIETIKEHL